MRRDNIKNLMAGEIRRDGKHHGAACFVKKRVSPEMAYGELFQFRRILSGLITRIQQPVESQARDFHPLITTRKRVGLLLEYPLGKTVRVFCVGGVLFI